MWFKNLRIYRFTEAFDTPAEELEELLQEFPFIPCGKHSKESLGWTAPLGRSGVQMVHSANGFHMICLQKEDKILPSSVINEALQERIELLEDKEGRKLFRKERLQIKDDVIAQLLPKAFSKRQKIFAYISPKDRLLVLNTGSQNQAETLLSFLRSTLDRLPVVPVATKGTPPDILTRWLKQGYGSDNFELEAEVELFNPKEDGNTVKCKGQDLASHEIEELLKAGKLVKKLHVAWKDKLTCVIEDNLVVKRLKFSDIILEKANEYDTESVAEQFDQDFTIMTLELNRFYKDLFRAFGGLERARLEESYDEQAQNFSDTETETVLAES